MPVKLCKPWIFVDSAKKNKKNKNGNIYMFLRPAGSKTVPKIQFKIGSLQRCL